MESAIKCCAACEVLAGQPGSAEPHTELQREQHFLRSDGVSVREVYRCRCGAKLERLVAAQAFGGESGRWKTLKGR